MRDDRKLRRRASEVPRVRAVVPAGRPCHWGGTFRVQARRASKPPELNQPECRSAGRPEKERDQLVGCACRLSFIFHSSAKCSRGLLPVAGPVASKLVFLPRLTKNNCRWPVTSALERTHRHAAQKRWRSWGVPTLWRCDRRIPYERGREDFIWSATLDTVRRSGVPKMVREKQSMHAPVAGPELTKDQDLAGEVIMRLNGDPQAALPGGSGVQHRVPTPLSRWSQLLGIATSSSVP